MSPRSKFFFSAALIFGIALCVPSRAQEPATPVTPAATEAKPVDAKPAEKPLPDLASLMARTKAHQAANEEIAKNYTFKRTVIADEFDSKGTKKGTHTDEYQIFFVKNWRIGQHIAHDGKPLSESDAKKEQERVDKDVREIKEGKKKENKGNIKLGVTEMMKVAAFSNPRREKIDGRDTIIFDYKGDPKARTSDISEVIMQKLSGSVWIDEQDAAVRRINGHLDENYRYGGILVNIKKGSWFDLQQVRINDEIWFSKTFDAHADGRILLFKGIDSDIHQRSSEYRKMKTTITLLPGSQVIGEDGQPIPNIEAEPEAPTTSATPAPKP